jgi:hypothetical protein
MKTGDMLLWRDHLGGPLRGIIERWIVRHSTASPYTHVGVCWAEHDRVWVMEITTKGCAPRLLSGLLAFDWAPAPRALSDGALAYAFSLFGVLVYFRWRAIKGQIGRLIFGKDAPGQCAEFSLDVWLQDGMAPSTTATPGACADGAMSVWKAAITPVEA